MQRRYKLPLTFYRLSVIGYGVGKISQHYMSVPRPIRWHLASIAGASTITCIANMVLVDKGVSSNEQFSKNRMMIAGIATEALIFCREKQDQISTGHGKFDYIDMWGGTAAIVCAVVAYKFANRPKNPGNSPIRINQPTEG